MRFKVGDVLLFNYDKGTTAYFIQMYNRWEYGMVGPTHCGIIGEVKKNSVIVYEAMKDGFVKNEYGKSELNNLVNTYVVYVRRAKGLKNVQANCEKYLGRGYGYLDILSITLSFMTGWRFLGVTGARKLICSEAVARVLYDASKKKLNIAEEFNKSYNLVTPMDIEISRQLKDA